MLYSIIEKIVKKAEVVIRFGLTDAALCFAIQQGLEFFLAAGVSTEVLVTVAVVQIVATGVGALVGIACTTYTTASRVVVPMRAGVVCEV